MANIKRANRKKPNYKRIAMVLGLIAAVIVVIFLINHFKTYKGYRVISEVEIAGKVSETKYFPLGQGYVKYSNDGISYIYDGEIAWTKAFEMTNPVLDSNGIYFAVGALKSSEVYLFSSEGEVGVINTSYPIIDVEVSDYGVIAALMQDNNINYIELKDKDGNLLAQGRTSFEGSGYPLDIAISPDGTTLAVSYLCVSNGVTTSRVVFYDYTDKGDIETDRIKAGFDFEGSVIPTLYYADSTSVYAVGDNVVATFNAGGKVELKDKKEVDSEIKSVFFGEGKLGVVTVDEEDSSLRRVSIYDKSGKLDGQFSTDFRYQDIEMISGGVLMYSTEKCRIYTYDGKEKFDTSFDNSVVYMMGIGSNRYILATSDKMQIIKLT